MPSSPGGAGRQGPWLLMPLRDEVSQSFVSELPGRLLSGAHPAGLSPSFSSGGSGPGPFSVFVASPLCSFPEPRYPAGGPWAALAETLL